MPTCSPTREVGGFRRVLRQVIGVVDAAPDPRS